MRILIVDDEPPIGVLVRAVCRRDGHEVTTCTSSIEARHHLEATTFDLMITDIEMPPPDGLQLVREARRLQPDLTAIVMTGYTARYTLPDVLAAGASDLMFKPFQTEELRARVTLAEGRRKLVSGRSTTVAARADRLQEDQPLAAPEVLAEQHVRGRDLFWVTMLDKVRAPISAIAVAVTDLLQGGLGDLNGAQRESLESVRRNVNHLKAVIDDSRESAGVAPA